MDRKRTHLRIEAVLQPNDVGMRILDELPHDLQLAILEPLVLQDLLDGHDLPRLHYGRLEDDAERPVADDALGGVRYGLLPGVSRRSAGTDRRGGGTGRRGGSRGRGGIVVIVVGAVTGMMSSRTGPGAGARRSLLMLPLLGPGRRTCGGICRFYCCCSSRRAACCCRRSRARSSGRTCRICAVGRHGMFPGGRLRMMTVMARRVIIIIAIAVRMRVVMMGSTCGGPAGSRCICVREAAPAVVVIIVRIRRGRSGAVSGQRTRRRHRRRRGGQGGHLSRKLDCAGTVGREERAKVLFTCICYAKAEGKAEKSKRYFLT